MHHWNKHGWPLNNRDLNCPGSVIHEVFSIVNATVVQSLSRVWLLETTRTAACQASLSFTLFQNLFKLMSIESMMPFSHLILCRPILLLPSVFPSIRVFSNESALHIRWSKCWSFSFSIILPVNIQGWFALGLTDLIFLKSKGLSRVFSSTTIPFW